MFQWLGYTIIHRLICCNAQNLTTPVPRFVAVGELPSHPSSARMPVDGFSAEREATADIANLSLLTLPTEPTTRNLLLRVIRKMTSKEPTQLPNLAADRERTARLMRYAKNFRPVAVRQLTRKGRKHRLQDDS
jgi:hypothetical protein